MIFSTWQEPSQRSPGRRTPKFSTSVNVVNVLATVRDQKGKIVHDLVQDEFTIQEDGRPQSIRYFSQQSDLPLTLGLLLDTSGSQTRVLDQERNASYEFFEHILREDKDKAFLIHFDREVELLQDLTSSRKDLEAALRDADRPQLNRRSPRNGTARPRARPVASAEAPRCTMLFSSPRTKSSRSSKGAKRSCCCPTASIWAARPRSAARLNPPSAPICWSTPSASPTKAAAVRLASAVPGIGRGGRRGGRFPQPSDGQRREPVDGKKILERISQETGGGYFEVSGKMPLDKIYDQIEEELRNQYSLGYTPDQSSGGYHKILVSVKRKGLTVRARDGYYS